MDVENSITRDLWLPTLGIFIVVASRSEVAGRVLHFRIGGTSSIKILPANTYAFHRIRGLRSMVFFLLSQLARFRQFSRRTVHAQNGKMQETRRTIE